METKDVIFTREKLVKTIYDRDHARCLQDDKNCLFLLNSLLEKPMTFMDIKMAFEEVDATKSDKTIYGYLNKLKKAGLVMEAGKRVISDPERIDKRIRDLTLYSRTAKVFYIALESGSETAHHDSYISIIAKITRILLDRSGVDSNKFQEYYHEFAQQKRGDIEELNKIDDKDILTLLSSFDSRSVKYIIDTICWLTFIGRKEKVHEDLINSFK
ncbi:MAG: hypothetical protein FK733_01680 [Asgard group archaeon]|nr:hypothetical protein [Asgard group archaeon]